MGELGIRGPSRGVSGVTAAVLTLGEATTDRALASLEAQTLAVERVVVVRGVRPFHAALNQAAAQSTTPFLLQVDADMVLEPGCVATSPIAP